MGTWLQEMVKSSKSFREHHEEKNDAILRVYFTIEGSVVTLKKVELNGKNYSISELRDGAFVNAELFDDIYQYEGTIIGISYSNDIKDSVGPVKWIYMDNNIVIMVGDYQVPIKK